ncbi:Uncharacterised protein [Exiguobacterium aurantiacum]|uniref:Uncharacterized protein n=1 Tax=Exiguobacterium aurantiacum TaxID=33987 RepID=A0A377HHB3_9BACL|nr:Uncharacterised protein [Exiguobacterium aurantiacum]
MLFSKRNNQKEIEIFPYDNTLPDRLRKQIYHLLVDVIRLKLVMVITHHPTHCTV